MSTVFAEFCRWSYYVSDVPLLPEEIPLTINKITEQFCFYKRTKGGDLIEKVPKKEMIATIKQMFNLDPRPWNKHNQSACYVDLRVNKQHINRIINKKKFRILSFFNVGATGAWTYT
eukprot:TRINITY_DN5125_c0_g1_i1.p1 TRINITY_DN5125_c0_g1~~TRINITY_DN5125_c0_g1_i1.p1  ORF type:complete len:117 (-),score=1.36 TRINITY_DN5125_c0_g1_i1:472-822(-)